MASARQDAFKAEARAHARAIYQGIVALKALQSEWTHAGYGEALEVVANEPTVAEFLAAIHTTGDALHALLGQGHGTNLTKLL